MRGRSSSSRAAAMVGRGAISGEEALAAAIVGQAVEDAAGKDRALRRDAERWLNGPEGRLLMEYLGIYAGVMRMLA